MKYLMQEGRMIIYRSARKRKDLDRMRRWPVYYDESSFFISRAFNKPRSVRRSTCVFARENID